MNQNKKRVVGQHQKVAEQDPQQITSLEQDTLSQIYKQLDQLFKMRFVQRLARPIEVAKKHQQVKIYFDLLESIHKRLQRFRVNLIQKINIEEHNREKSMDEELTSKNVSMKKKIRAIQSKYNEIFYEGSYKYYPKLKQLFNLQTQIETFQIVEWANDCIERLVGSTSNSCC